jgi:hypothetical protein
MLAACVTLAADSLTAMLAGDDDQAERLLSRARAAIERVRARDPQRRGGKDRERSASAARHEKWRELAAKTHLKGRARARWIAHKSNSNPNTVRNYLERNWPGC